MGRTRLFMVRRVGRQAPESVLGRGIAHEKVLWQERS